MLPLVNTAYIPFTPQPSLVNTAIPGNIAQRVPYDNVTPPVSSPRAEPDARGNPQIIISGALPADTPEEITTSSAGAQRFSGAPFGTPATIIAQFIGQPANNQPSGQLQIILKEYEKLIGLSQIKYKPSNATKPQAEPAGAFGKLLEQTNSKTIKTTVRAESSVNATPQASPAPPPRAATRSASSQPITSDFESNDAQNAQTFTLPAQAIPTQAIRSYQQSIARNDAEIAIA